MSQVPPVGYAAPAAILALAAVTEAIVAGEGWRTAAVSAIACAALAWVRLAPLPVAAVVLACYAAVPGATQTVLTVVPYLIALAFVGRFESLVSGAGIALGAALVLGLTDLDAVKSVSHLAGNLLYYGLFSSALVGGGQLLKYGEHRERQLVELARDIDEGAAERERLAVAMERRRMARELHDVIAQAITVVGVHSAVARATLGQDRDRAMASLERIETAAEQASVDMRRLLGLLREDGAEPLPHLGRLDELVSDARTAGLTLGIECALDPTRPLPPAIDLAVYRVVQECLSNCRRHAPGADVDIRITARESSVTVKVEDNGGPGLPSNRQPAGAGLGLIGMRERVALYGGQLEAGPVGRGFRVVATFALDQ